MLRDQEIITMYLAGKTQDTIGKHFGITKMRVSQILKFWSVPRKENKIKDSIEKRSNKYIKRYRYAKTAEYEELVKIGELMIQNGSNPAQTPIGAFYQHRANARYRGIEWNLTLWDWWKIWNDSGKWELRGRRHNEYQMCRCGDEGPYQKDNVYIDFSHNNAALGGAKGGKIPKIKPLPSSD